MSTTTKDAGWDANTSVPGGCDDSSRSAASSLLDDICRLVTLPCSSTTVVTTRPCRFSDRFYVGWRCSGKDFGPTRTLETAVVPRLILVGRQPFSSAIGGSAEQRGLQSPPTGIVMTAPMDRCTRLKVQLRSVHRPGL